MAYLSRNIIFSLSIGLLFSCGQSEEDIEKDGAFTEEVNTSIEEEAEAEEEKDQRQSSDIDMEELTKDLAWIEKFFVKDDPLRLYSLLKFKEDERHIQLGKKLTEKEEMFPLEIMELDTKNGYIKFFQPTVDCHNTLTYWNKSNRVKLIASVQNCCTMFCDADISFEVYSENIGYEKLDVNTVVPDYKELRRITPEGHIDGDGYDIVIKLPKKGKDISYCIENSCKTLEWSEGKFVLKKESKPDVDKNDDHAVDAPEPISVRDDPDYIGTPCEYVDGECIRHNHKK